MSKKENRQYHRIPYSGPARISWEDEHGLIRFAHAKCIDVSEGGLRIEMSESIPVRSQISLRADRINLSGSATVRNIRWRAPQARLCRALLAASARSSRRSARY